MLLRSCRIDVLGALLLVFLVGCEEGPQTATDYYLLSLKELNADHPSVAMEHCNKAIELEPNNCDVYSVRALVHAALGNSQESMADWKKAIDLAPDEDARANLIESQKKSIEAQDMPPSDSITIETKKDTETDQDIPKDQDTQEKASQF